MPLFSKSVIIILFIGSFNIVPCYGNDDFPRWQDTLVFREDLRASALITNLPNLTSEDYYIGLKITGAGFSPGSGVIQSIPSVRLSLYPTPNYNIWLDFAKWPEDRPAFSVGTGLQVEFPSENLKTRKAISLSWNEVNASHYTQRDIRTSALFARTWKSVHLGFIVNLNLHHVLVEDGNGIPDYDNLFFQVVPYFNFMLGQTIRMVFLAPADSKGVGLAVSCEWLWGERK